MKLVGVQALVIPDIATVKFARFSDNRGYFTETFRQSDFDGPQTPFLNGVRWMQANESFSRRGVVRGLHFQWNPYMGKLIRTIRGHMVDVVLDIRKGSPTFGKIIGHDMPAHDRDVAGEWIWVPPGFAHGNTFIEDTTIEYFCSGEYSPGCEAGISPLAADLDWSLCDPALRDAFLANARDAGLMTDKDRNGFTLGDWAADSRSDNFIYGAMGS
ncbi:MAG: dTDP-4-dehydrorhamnose 3,5-epimerase family protein [Thermomicrobiales bacterium]|nr:dTDP-4-dehydrorhamnose 3,5-epimerase family protein [Thermomicrobiales bacterium]